MNRKENNPPSVEVKTIREREAARKLASMGGVAAGDPIYELVRAEAESGYRRRWKRVERNDEPKAK